MTDSDGKWSTRLTRRSEQKRRPLRRMERYYEDLAIRIAWGYLTASIRFPEIIQILHRLVAISI